MLIIAITLIAAVACQNGFIKGPDGYKYIIPEEKMELPEPKQLLDYLPPIDVRSDDANIEVGDFAPYVIIEETVADTTLEPETA